MIRSHAAPFVAAFAVPFAVLFAGLSTVACAEPRGACTPEPAPGQLGSICGFSNPEDVESVPALGIVAVSQMRHGEADHGSLAAFRPTDAAQVPVELWPGAAPRGRREPRVYGLDTDPACQSPPGGDFSPHGLASAATEPGDDVILAVVSHAPREAIELFRLSRAAGVLARWVGCIPLPPDSVGNDVAFGRMGEVFVADQQPARGGLGEAVYAVAAGLGFETGAVLRKLGGGDWQTIANSGGAGPNGVAHAKRDARIWFSQTGTGRVSARDLRDDADRVDVDVEGHPDNLSWDADGALLVVTHTQGVRHLACAFGRRPCSTAWSLLAIDPLDPRPVLLLHHDGSVVGAAASVARVGDRYYVGAVFDDRIGVWSPGDAGGGVLNNPGPAARAKE